MPTAVRVPRGMKVPKQQLRQAASDYHASVAAAKRTAEISNPTDSRFDCCAVILTFADKPGWFFGAILPLAKTVDEDAELDRINQISGPGLMPAYDALQARLTAMKSAIAWDKFTSAQEAEDFLLDHTRQLQPQEWVAL